MSKNKVQRIKLMLDGSAVKWDASIVEVSPDGKTMVVEFDGPIDTTRLYRWSDNVFINRRLGPHESPAQFADIQMWKIL